MYLYTSAHNAYITISDGVGECVRSYKHITNYQRLSFFLCKGRQIQGQQTNNLFDEMRYRAIFSHSFIGEFLLIMSNSFEERDGKIYKQLSLQPSLLFSSIAVHLHSSKTAIFGLANPHVFTSPDHQPFQYSGCSLSLWNCSTHPAMF